MDTIHGIASIRLFSKPARQETILPHGLKVHASLEKFKVQLHRETDDARASLREQTRMIAREISEKVLGRGVQ